MSERIKCKCGLIPLTLTDGARFKVVCTQCMVGTKMKATSEDANAAWTNGSVFDVGIDFKTTGERHPKKKFWEFLK